MEHQPVLNDKVSLVMGSKHHPLARMLLFPDRIELRGHRHRVWLSVPLASIDRIAYIKGAGLYFMAQGCLISVSFRGWRNLWRPILLPFLVPVLFGVVIEGLAYASKNGLISEVPIVTILLFGFIYGLKRTTSTESISSPFRSWKQELEKLGVTFSDSIDAAQFQKMRAQLRVATSQAPIVR